MENFSKLSRMPAFGLGGCAGLTLPQRRAPTHGAAEGARRALHPKEGAALGARRAVLGTACAYFEGGLSRGAVLRFEQPRGALCLASGVPGSTGRSLRQKGSTAATCP
jgi:hypothetical protein